MAARTSQPAGDLRKRLLAETYDPGPYGASLSVLPARLAGIEGRIASLHLHPVKSLGILDVEALRVTRSGLAGPHGLRDRGAMVGLRTPEGPSEFVRLSQREEGALALARPRIHDGKLIFDADGLRPLTVAPADLLAHEGPRVRAAIDGALVDAVEETGPLTAWVRDFLRAHRRGRYDPDDVSVLLEPRGFARRVPDRHRAEQEADTLYTDGAQVLLASQGSLDWLNGIRENTARTVPMGSFRPNIVVEGWPANVEDVVEDVAVETEDGPVRLLFGSLCVRCDTTRTDPSTGDKPDRDPLQALARYRPPRLGSPRGATFAINAVFPAEAEGAVVRVGNRVRILGEKP